MPPDNTSLTLTAAQLVAQLHPASPVLAPEIPPERVEEILAGLNSFVVHEYEHGTNLVHGRAVRVSTIAGTDYNLDQAIEWALEQPEVSTTCGPPGAYADVELLDGTLLVWSPDILRWAIAVGTDLDTGRAVAAQVQAEPATPPRERPTWAWRTASDFVISRGDKGEVGIRHKTAEPTRRSGKLIGCTVPFDDLWQVTWIDQCQRAHTAMAVNSIVAEAVLFEKCGIDPAEVSVAGGV